MSRHELLCVSCMRKIFEIMLVLKVGFVVIVLQKVGFAVTCTSSSLKLHALHVNSIRMHVTCLKYII